MMKERFETFTVLINRISRSIRKIKNQEMAEYKLRSVHVSCIYYIYRLEKCTATDLCEHCQEDKATISRALDYLETNGFILRESAQKRYTSPISLTEKGTEAGKKTAEKIDKVLVGISECLTDDERREFYRCLGIISKSLESLSKNCENED